MHTLLRVSAALVLFMCGAQAQSFTSLNGTVTDASGGVVPSVAIEIKNQETQAGRSVLSDSQGRYVFAEVVPGRYRLEAKAAGFKSEVVEELQLQVNSPATLNLSLQVGAVSDAIAVTAEAVLVNTTDASIGNAIGEKPIVELPFEARNVVGLLALQPGVVYISNNAATPDYRSGAVNGGKSDQGNVTLDGVDVNDQQYRYAFTSVLRVTLDSVQEFRTTTSNFNADQGRSSGAQVALVTKSGTNSLHGSVFEFNRNTLTSANTFFNNAAGVPRQALIRNVFGGSAGGPIKKDKLFIFGSYEGRRDASQGGGVRIVPNANYRQGTFTYIRKDGSTGQLTPAQIAAQADPLHIGPDPAVLKYLQQFPLPNDNSVGDGLNTAGYRFNSGKPLRYNTYIGRVDYNLNAKHQLFFRGNLQNDHYTDSIPQFPGQADSALHLENAKGLATGDTWLISSSLVNSFRYGLTRQSFDSTGLQTQDYVELRSIDDLFPTTRGLKATIPAHTVADDVTWNKGAHSLAFGGAIRFITANRLNFANSFSRGYANSSWLQGTGSNLLAPDAKNSTLYTRLMTDMLGIVSQGDAHYNYDIQGSVLPEGSGIARQFVDHEFELYLQDTWKVSRGFTVTAGLRASLSPPLREGKGIQTSTNIPLSDWFNERGALAAKGLPQSQAPDINFDLSSKPGGRGMYPFQHDFSPRLGLAWSPQGHDGFLSKLTGGPGKTSIRAGAGMYYDVFGQSLIRLVDNTALGFSSFIQNPANASALTAPRFTGFTSLPSGLLIPAPKGGFPQTAPDIWAIASSLDDKLASPYTINLNFSMERELKGGLMLQAAYVGRLSRKSLIGDDVAIPTNLVDPASGQSYFQAASQMMTFANQGVATSKIPKMPFFENFYPGYAGGGLTASQSIYSQFYTVEPDATTVLLDIDGPGCDPCGKYGPFQQWSKQYSSLAVYRSRGTGAYHSLQLSARKRFSSGLLFDFNYTYGRSIDMSSTRETDGVTSGQIINPWDPRQMRAVSDYDTTHIFTAFFVYELPVGKGKPLLGGSNKALNAFVGGWQLSGIYRQTSGFPVGVGNGGFWPTNWNLSGYGTQLTPLTAGTVRNATVPNGGPYMFADPAAALNAFAFTLPGQTGSRNTLRGDGIFNIDASVSKRFAMPFNEKHALQIRAEVFNLTNTSTFDVNTVSLNLGSPTTFGKYSSTLNTPRVMQFGAKYIF
ncbi:MAG TPA: carboxypeptidase-like regulatory domain-containing protein [Candidatus Acidoferrales bacterium]|nr:carboxypeptidase-like regulatory domain-containing protein [Candidatus Acidoferrales bacterium]